LIVFSARPHRKFIVAFAVAATLALVSAAAPEDPDAGSTAIPNRKVADMLFELALANRKVYTRDIVQRLASGDGAITASEHYLDQRGLPLPAQVFRLSAEELLGSTDDFWLQLRALDPINFANGPITPVEEEGLQFVAENPEQPFYAEERGLAGRPSLVAVYADVANVEACVTCHNSHPKSPRRDFKLGDVMGGIIVRVFLD